MMEVPTVPIRKTSTCPRPLVRTLIWPPFAAWTSSACAPSGSTSTAVVRCLSVASSSMTIGATTVAARACHETPSFGASPTSRWGGGDDTARARAPLSVHRVRANMAAGHRESGPPKAKISSCGLRWALAGIVVGHLSVSRVAAGLAVAWHAANSAVLAEGKRFLINDPARFENVTVIGVDGHIWRHTRKGDQFVTVIIYLTPVRTETGPSRLLDRSGKTASTSSRWTARRHALWQNIYSTAPERKCSSEGSHSFRDRRKTVFVHSSRS